MEQGDNNYNHNYYRGKRAIPYDYGFVFMHLLILYILGLPHYHCPNNNRSSMKERLVLCTGMSCPLYRYVMVSLCFNAHIFGTHPFPCILTLHIRIQARNRINASAMETHSELNFRFFIHLIDEVSNRFFPSLLIHKL